jgi:hypothetical protein
MKYKPPHPMKVSEDFTALREILRDQKCEKGRLQRLKGEKLTRVHRTKTQADDKSCCPYDRGEFPFEVGGVKNRRKKHGIARRDTRFAY